MEILYGNARAIQDFKDFYLFSFCAKRHTKRNHFSFRQVHHADAHLEFSVCLNYNKWFHLKLKRWL